MKKNIIKILFFTLITSTPIVGQGAAHVWTDWYPVGQVYVYSGGTIFISFRPSSAHSNPAECASSSWLRIMPDQVGKKEMYQMALTAQAAGLRLNAYVSGTECAGSYPKIVHLRSVQ